MPPTSQTKTVVQTQKPALDRRDQRSDKPVGRPLDPSVLKQIGGGCPVASW